MAKPVIVKVNQLVFYLDKYLHDHKVPKAATKLEKQEYAIAVQCVEILKEVFMVPYLPSKPFCRTPWYGANLSAICKTPWMGKPPLFVAKPVRPRTR